MTARAYSRGHPVVCDDAATWRWADTGEPIGDRRRPCASCGERPTAEGHDACLGHIPGARAACCGHGVEPGYVLMAGEGEDLVLPIRR